MNDSSLDEQQIRIPPHEDEVCEFRLEAKQEDIEAVSDRFIRNYYFEGIPFLDIIIGKEGARRIYFGMLRDGDTKNAITRTLGYIEVTSLNRLSPVGARVRIVCAWPPMYKFWEELCQALKNVFPVILMVSGVTDDEGHSNLNTTIKKAGPKFRENYDRAYRRIIDGEKESTVFSSWCEQEGIKNPDALDHRKFNEAMRRRGKHAKK